MRHVAGMSYTGSKRPRSASLPSLTQNNNKDEHFERRIKKQNVRQKERIVPQWMEYGQLLDDNKVSLSELLSNGITLHAQLVSNLKNEKIQFLFPVQSAVIAHILFTHDVVGGDVCVCAPTGSGKTLAYVVPIVQTLLKFTICRIRALVIVPTRDLVIQVTSVFDQMIRGTNLVVVGLHGDKSQLQERSELLDMKKGIASSLVDIIVSTPGRIVDHITDTPGFTLEHLEYLVVDEADRLMMQSYQDWLAQVLQSIQSSRTGSITKKKDGTFLFNPICYTHSGNEEHPRNVGFSSSFPPLLQKLLFSATLSQNPRKIASLKLVNPKYFYSTKQYIYKIPQNLKQELIICPLKDKPLYLLIILRKYRTQQMLCFTSSVESTHRLTLLLQLLIPPEELTLAEYSGALAQKDREALMTNFKAGKISLVICSDVFSRGLDVEDVGLVINYDVPQYAPTYVHRVGRTARAGKEGRTITLARFEEVKHFKEMLSKVENSKQSALKIDRNTEIDPLIPLYEEALRQLSVKLTKGQSQPGFNKTLKMDNIQINTQNLNDREQLLKALKEQAKSLFFPPIKTNQQSTTTTTTTTTTATLINNNNKKTAPAATAATTKTILKNEDDNENDDDIDIGNDNENDDDIDIGNDNENDDDIDIGNDNENDDESSTSSPDEEKQTID